MERKKVIIVFMVFMFIFFDLSYGEKDEKSSTNFISDTINLSFVSNLEKKLENNFISTYNKKNYKTYISSNENIDKLKIENKKSPYLYKSYVVLNNGNDKEISSNIMYIKKNNPHVSKEYISEGEENKLGNSSYSFIEEASIQLVDAKVSSDYVTLMRKINDSYQKGKDIYMQSFSYKEMERYFKNKSEVNYTNYKDNIVPSIDKMTKDTKQYMNYCKQSKEDMRKKMNKLEELVGNDKEASTFKEKLEEFKTNIQQIEKKLDDDFKAIEEEKKNVYTSLDNCLCAEYVKDGVCNDVKDVYSTAFDEYNTHVTKQTKMYSELSRECEAFTLTDTKLKKIKGKDFCKKEHKYALKLLMEEIGDIMKSCMENEIKLNEQIRLFEAAKKESTNFQFNKTNLSETITFPSFVYQMYLNEQKLCEELKEDFGKKKTAIHELFKEIAKELGNEIESLIYPEDIYKEAETIVKDSEQVILDLDNLISRNSLTLENFYYMYSTFEMFTLREELIKLYAEAVTHNISLKGKLHLINEKFEVIKSEKGKIESLKAGVPRNDQKVLEDITDDVHSIKKSIESIKNSASSHLEDVRKEQQNFNEVKGKIEELIKKVQDAKERMKQLEKEEEEKKNRAEKEIEEKLKEIEEKKKKLKPFLDLKDKEYEDLNVSEKAIDASSCDNKDTYVQRKREAEEQIKSALKSLFSNGKIEKANNEIPQYVTRIRMINYKNYDLDAINGILLEVKSKCTEIDEVIKEGTATIDNNVTPAETKIMELKNSIIKESIEDLYKKLQTSYDSFNSTMSSLSVKMNDYEQKNIKLRSCEENIAKKKSEFLNKLAEKDCETLEGKDTSEETLDLEESLIQTKNQITIEISNGRIVIGTIKEQLGLYNKIAEFLAILDSDPTSEKLKALKTTIEGVNIDNKVNEYQTTYDSTTNSIEDYIKKVKLSKQIIEGVKILNKVINESNKNNESIDNSKRTLKELEQKIDAQTKSITDDDLIESDVKEKLLGSLKEKRDKIEAQTNKIDDLEKKSKELLQFCTNFKGTIGSSTEDDMKTHSQTISRNNEQSVSFTGEISALSTEIATSSAEVDNLIKAQNIEIVNLIYSLIIKLNEEISSKVNKSVVILEETEKSFEEYNMEDDVKNINNETNRGKIRELSQNFLNFKDDINKKKSTFVEIQNKSKGKVDDSNKIKENIEKNDNRSEIKKIHADTKQILEEYNTMEKELQISLANMNEKKIEYKKTLAEDYYEQITDKKKKADAEIKIIDEYKERINQLKNNIPNTIDCVLENYDYESYASNAKNNQNRINSLESEVSEIRRGIPSIKEVNGMHMVQTTMEEKLKEVIIEKGKIDNVSMEIKHMEMMLASTTLSIVMEDIEKSAQKAKEEEGYAEKKFKESEEMKEKIWNDLRNADKLADLGINNLEEKSINESIEQIMEVYNSIESDIEKIKGILTKAEQHKAGASLYYKNTERGKEKILYLKNHDKDKEEVNITTEVEETVNRHVSESKNNSNKADTYAQDTKNIYELSLKYGTEMKNILDESLVLGEKLKVSIKKNEAIDILVEIQNEYYDNIYLSEKLVERLSILREEDAHKKNEEDSNNDKSTDAFTKIEITRTNANSTIQEIEGIKNKTLQIMNAAELELEAFIIGYEKDYDESTDKLQIEKDALQKVSNIFTEFNIKKKEFTVYSDRLKEIITKVYTLEMEMERNKTQYEEGIIEEIKKISDQEKNIIELLKESMKKIMDTSIAFMRDSALGDEMIIQKFKDPKKNMDKKCVSFDESYKEIEKGAKSILEGPNTYRSVKAKREKYKAKKKKTRRTKQGNEPTLE